MASATAHLGTASATLGEGVNTVDEQLAFLRAERRPDGGWGDPPKGEYPEPPEAGVVERT